MPTYEVLEKFLRDYARLTAEQREAFLRARDELVADLRAGQGFRRGLRVKRVQASNEPVWEMSWAGDGRATWQYGPERVRGEPHVIWRRIGTHSILSNP